MNDNLVVAWISVEKVEVTRSCQLVQDLVNEQKREVVLLGSRVQLSIVDANSPLRPKAYLDFLALLVSRDYYSGFPRNNVYRTHPLAIGYGMDNFCVEL